MTAASEIPPGLRRVLSIGQLPRARHALSELSIETVLVPMRDGVRLATEILLPPNLPAPVVAIRTPYGRGMEERGFAATLVALARQGYAVVSQDCRGTGDSEPDHWDYYVYESEDGPDLIAWIARQSWCDGFIGSFGNSYAGQTQWAMATHPAMSTIVPSMSGLGFAAPPARKYMFLNTYALVMGKGAAAADVHFTEMEQRFEVETMAGGYFRDPLDRALPASALLAFPELGGLSPNAARASLWERYCSLAAPDRADLLRTLLDHPEITSVTTQRLPQFFGTQIPQDAHTIPTTDAATLARKISAPPLIRTGWYDWCLNDAIATWTTLTRHGQSEVAKRARLLITPYAHNLPGYHEDAARHPELRLGESILDQAGLLHLWYQNVRQGDDAGWPRVIYYLMGANVWRSAEDWPVPGGHEAAFYLARAARLTRTPPAESGTDSYVYDPGNPTPTIGGSIVSYHIPVGSVDVAEAQGRSDVLAYTSAPLARDVDMVGPLRMILYASSSARDTDFVARLSDVHPDGRAMQIQNGFLRARYRNGAEPEPLVPGAVYCLEIDMWSTAHRFRAGHSIRIDIASADFPRYDRHANSERGEAVAAHQCIYFGPEHPSRLICTLLEPAA